VAKPLGAPRQSIDGEGAYTDVRDRAGYGENEAPRRLSPSPAAPLPALHGLLDEHSGGGEAESHDHQTAAPQPGAQFGDPGGGGGRFGFEAAAGGGEEELVLLPHADHPAVDQQQYKDGCEQGPADEQPGQKRERGDRHNRLPAKPDVRTRPRLSIGISPRLGFVYPLKRVEWRGHSGSRASQMDVGLGGRRSCSNSARRSRMRFSHPASPGR